jgi:CYTH domain-containing protein
MFHEIEKTYLAKYLPEGLLQAPYKEIIDIYFPTKAEHPKLRLRKNGEKYEMTKKTLVNPADASSQIENTIPLSKDEFEELSQLPGKRVRKLRYYYDYDGLTAEIDVFQDALQGLVVIEFEFQSEEQLQAFRTPDFCLVDITQEDFIAGGMLCGKSYEDISNHLKKFGYIRQ